MLLIFFFLFLRGTAVYLKSEWKGRHESVTVMTACCWHNNQTFNHERAAFVFFFAYCLIIAIKSSICTDIVKIVPCMCAGLRGLYGNGLQCYRENHWHHTRQKIQIMSWLSSCWGREEDLLCILHPSHEKHTIVCCLTKQAFLKD